MNKKPLLETPLKKKVSLIHQSIITVMTKWPPARCPTGARASVTQVCGLQMSAARCEGSQQTSAGKYDCRESVFG